MSVSDDERETLHFMLDALLNARSTLEGVDRTKVQPGMHYHQAISRPRGELFRNGSAFLRRVLGSKLHQEELSELFSAELEENTEGAHLAATIANSIRSFLPLFMQSGRYEGKTYSEELDENIEKIISDLMGMYWGDEPRFFSPWPRRQGLHKRPYRIARLRLAALDWDKFLAVVGMPAFERHRIISEAYRTDWDAIRKWSQSINDQYDLRSCPPENSEWARRDFEANPEAIILAIRRDGDAYWQERGSSSHGKEN